MIVSCLNYPGSKRRVYDLIDELLPDGIITWVEPFFGSGSVTFGFLQSEKSKNCKEFIVGDLYSEVYNFWKQLQVSTKNVVQAIDEEYDKHFPKHREYIKALSDKILTDDEMYILREDMKEEGNRYFKQNKTHQDILNYGTPEERAARFWIISKISFSGGCDSSSLSVHRLTEFNLDLKQGILDMTELIKPLDIRNVDFRETMACASSDGGFIFLDPPYFAQEGAALYGFNGSTHKGFPHKDFIETTRNSPAKWLVTYDDSVFVRRGFAGFHMKPFKLNYTMAGDKASSDALDGEELFIANYPIENEQNEEETLDML